MYKSFDLKILTPEQAFFENKAEALTLNTSDGQITFLADHSPLIAPVEVGAIKILIDNEWKEAFSSNGFLEVTNEGIMVYTQTCEWPDEMDERLANEEKDRGEEQQRQKQSILEYKRSKIGLARAMSRLQLNSSYRKK